MIETSSNIQSGSHNGEQLLDALARVLGVRGREKWPAMERLWFRRLAPMFSLIPGLEKWSAAERKNLVGLIRAKGRPQESGFVRLLAGNRKLRRALESVARKG